MLRYFYSHNSAMMKSWLFLALDCPSFCFYRRFAQIISGKDAAADISKQLQAEVASFGPSFKPGLTILQVI